MSGANQHPCHKDGILAQEARGRTVLLRVDDGSYYALDAVGGRIWELCDGGRSIAEIAAAIAAEFDAPAQDVAADVRDLVEELRAEGLLAEAP